MNGIEIQPITKENWEQAVAIKVDDDQKPFVPSVTESLANAYLKPWDEALDPYVLLTDGMIIGAFYISYTPGSKDNYWIGGFQIDKEHQGKGFGTRALSYIVEFMREWHPACCVLSLTVEKANSNAIRLYKKFGFISENKENDYAEVIYTLNLAEKILGTDKLLIDSSLTGEFTVE